MYAEAPCLPLTTPLYKTQNLFIYILLWWTGCRWIMRHSWPRVGVIFLHKHMPVYSHIHLPGSWFVVLKALRQSCDVECHKKKWQGYFSIKYWKKPVYWILTKPLNYNVFLFLMNFNNTLHVYIQLSLIANHQRDLKSTDIFLYYRVKFLTPLVYQ